MNESVLGRNPIRCAACGAMCAPNMVPGGCGGHEWTCPNNPMNLAPHTCNNRGWSYEERVIIRLEHCTGCSRNPNFGDHWKEMVKAKVVQTCDNCHNPDRYAGILSPCHYCCVGDSHHCGPNRWMERRTSGD